MHDSPRYRKGSWTIVEARTVEQLLDASDLFDNPITSESAADSLARSDHHLLLALNSENQAIGFVSGVEMRHPDKPPEMFINELGVATDWRRKGIARELVCALANIARTNGAYSLWTATEPDNVAALATYRSVGALTDETAVMVAVDLRPDAAE